jgi:hypothetical protein
MDVTNPIGGCERVANRAVRDYSRSPRRLPITVIVICTLAVLLAYTVARWWLAESARDRRGAAALAAVMFWLLILQAALRIAWAIARRVFPRAATAATEKLATLRLQITLAGLSFFVSLVLTEFAVRIWLPTAPLEWVSTENSTAQRQDWERVFCEFDSLLGWRGVPSRRGQFAIGGVTIRVEQNSFGFRDVEHDRATNRRQRLMLLGDSFVWGAGVGQDDTVSAQLRRRLDEFDVYNLGVCGYGTDQSLLNFERWGGVIEPTIVCYFFFANDPTDNQIETNHGHAKPRFTLVEGKLRLENVPLDHKSANATSTERPDASSRLSLIASVEHPLRSAILAADYFVSPHCVLYRQARRANMEWRRRQGPMNLDPLTSALIRRLKEQCDERGAALLVALIPDRGVMKYSNSLGHYASVRAWCESQGIPCLDLTPDLAASHESPYLFEGHWNPIGHRIAADAIARHVNSLGR